MDHVHEQTDGPNEQTDALWQAEVFVAHQQSALYRMIMIIALIVLLAAVWLIHWMQLSSAVTNVSSAGLMVLGVLLALGFYIVWRCPVCDASLGQADPEFCPHCGVQLMRRD